jgi:hypothetical protein
MTRLRFFIAVGALLLQACGGGDAFGPAHTDIDKAHADWLSNRSASYTFQVTVASSWFPAKAYLVSVENHVVVERVEILSGDRFADGQTIDDIWASILQAHQRNEVNHVRFDARGIPLTADVGSWPVDGGVSWQVRNYRPR